jgi:hypothetical protein
MSRIRSLVIFNFLALLVHIGMSVVTQFKLINNKDVAQVSDAYMTLITPSGITFAIWGVIYILLLAFTLYHVIRSFTSLAGSEANHRVVQIGPWFIINSLATSAWLYVWVSDNITGALALILLQLFSLIVIHARLGIHDVRHSAADKIFTQAPLSVYFGWISIATIANTAAYLVSIKWTGYGVAPAIWAQIIISVAVFIGVLLVLGRKNILYGLVVCWALYGIYTRQQQNGDPVPDISRACLVGAGVVGLVVVIRVINSLKKVKR